MARRSSSCAWTKSRKRSSCSSFMSISAWCCAWWRPVSDFTSSASGVGWAGCMTAYRLPRPGFRHQCSKVRGSGKEGRGSQGWRAKKRCLITQTKTQAWSSLVFHCCHSSFNPSEAPPWDSRPVSGAGVVHYQLLHRPRSVPTALGPAPLATVVFQMKQYLHNPNERTREDKEKRKLHLVPFFYSCLL